MRDVNKMKNFFNLSTSVPTLLACSLTMGSGLCATPTLAQDVPASTAEANNAEVETIIVTAEHRTQSSQTTAAALTVQKGDDMREQGRNTIQQILQDVPSVNFLDTLNSGHIANTDSPSSLIAIRGLRTNASFSPESPSTAPAVAAYIDGVFNGMGGSYDVDRVEVLRGPQGTLYGRSATAGVVSIHTTDPILGELSGFVLGELGSANLRHYSGAINIPLGEQAAIRVSANHLSRDGYYSKDGGAIDVTDERVKLLVKPTDRFSILVGVAVQQNIERSGGNTGSLTTAGTVDYSGRIPVGHGRDDSYQFWDEINWDLGPANLTHIGTFRSYTQSGVSYDAPQGTGTGAPLISNDMHTPDDTFITQELRLTSNGDARLKLQGGVFYYFNDIHTYSQGVLTGDGYPPQGILLSGPDIRRKTENLGVFAEATYDLSSSTRVTGGLRYDYTRVQTDETSRTGIVGGPYSELTIGGNKGRRTWRNVTYKLRLEQDLSPTSTVYALTATAFLPGDVGITTLVDDSNQTSLNVAPYDAQRLTSYEVGSKNLFFDRKLQVNGALFYYNFSGLQRTVQFGSNPSSQIPASSPARMLGAELELQYRPTPNDSIGLSFSYVDAYYHDKPALFAQGVAQREIAGVAPFSVNPNYTHVFHIGDGQTLSFRADAQYRSKHYWTDIQPQHIDTYDAMAKVKDQLNANVTITWNVSPRTTVSGYVHNIGDARYLLDSSTASINPTTTALGTAKLTEPRTFGILLQQSF